METLIFDAHKLYQALAYHLVEGGFGEYIDQDSFDYHRNLHLKVHKIKSKTWQRMNDEQRLAWLYERVDCEAYRQDDGALVFHHCEK